MLSGSHLPVFDKEEEKCENDFERWIYVLKNMETLKRMPFKARKAVFEKLEEIADVSSLNEEENELYWRSVNAYRTHLSVLEASRLEGREEGREEGRAEGREEGRAEGREEGSIEKCFSIARNLKQLGTSVDLISKATGLTPEEIAGL